MDPDRLRPTGNRVLVRTEPRETKPSGVIVNHGKEKNRVARVLRTPKTVSVKRGKKLVEHEPHVKPGDRVILEQFAHPEASRSWSEPYSDDGMVMLVQYGWIAGVLE